MAPSPNDTKPDSQPIDPDIPHVRAEPRPDFTAPPPRKPLPKDLQETLNSDEKLWDIFSTGRAPDSTSSDVRYAAYASRVRTILVSAQRYVAYTSDIGESFRPIAHPYLVRGAYGISWAYLIGDVSNEGYKAYVRNQQVLQPGMFPAGSPSSTPVKHAPSAQAQAQAQEAAQAQAKSTDPGIAATAVAATKDLVKPAPDTINPLDDYRTVMAQRAIFQAVASMGLPAFTIHSIVRYSGRALKDAKNKTIRTWGPIGLGLAAVPALPFLFDKPVEQVVEYVFHKGFEMVGKGGGGHIKEKEL